MTEAVLLPEDQTRTHSFDSCDSFDFDDALLVAEKFPSFDDYQEFLLDDIGVVKWFKAEKSFKAGRQITTGYGFILSQNGDTYFRLPACQKYEYDPITGQRKFVRQYRRVKPGQAVTMAVKESERGLRTEQFVFWEPSEFEKVARQETLNTAFEHRLVRVTKAIDLATNGTIDKSEEVLWQGNDLDQFRAEAPRIDPRFRIGKEEIPEGGVKTIVHTRVEYKDLLDGGHRKNWITCLDPR